jgi:squalene-hopene/tetraprenyl-beta-curcumene cyclase
MNNRKHSIARGIGIVWLAALAICGARADTPAPLSPAGFDVSLQKDALHATRIAVQWLEARQQENGCWSNPVFPAVTALAVTAIVSTPDVRSRGNAPLPESVRRALAFIAGCAQPDGSIYTPMEGVKGGGLPNYNTALSIVALSRSDDPAHAELVRKGRQWLFASQYLGPGVFHGGMAYDPAHQRPYADLSNTVMALEALRLTTPVEMGEAKDLDWDAAIAFVSRCQHLRATNDSDWVSEEPDQRGGFVYHPERSMADSGESGDGEANYMRSYGSMSYAGLLSFIHAKVDRDDPRVVAAREWLTAHWSLDENPGMGAQGLYYYYHTLSKALDAAGEDKLALADGKSVAWRPDFVRKMIELQRIDAPSGFGYWQNDNNRWWENDPVLVTAYTLKALSTALEE